MNVPPHKKAPAEFEIPDLDLPAPAPQTSRSGVLALTQPLTEARRSSSYNGLPEPELELESPLGVSPPLELDSSGPIARDHSVPDYAAGRSFGSDAPEVDSAKAASTLAIGDEAGANWPTGETPPRERLRLDPTEIRLLAAFGTPSFGPLNVVYALRVAFRRLALKRALRELNRELTEAEHARDAILAELASELRPVLRESPTFERSFAPLAALDALSAERSAALSVLEGDARAELTRLASERSAERNLVTELSRQSSAAAAVADARRHARERLEAREKRCHRNSRAAGAERRARRSGRRASRGDRGGARGASTRAG